MNLYSARVLVTGATGGIGHAIARALAVRGARLVLTGRRAEVLEPLAAEVGGEAIVCDFTDRDAVRELARRAADVDALVANAAVPASGRVVEYSEEEVDSALDINLRAPIVLARAAAQAMSARRHGHLVFVSSMSGKAASPGGAMYSATKFGLRGFALGLREDLHAHNVGVSTVFPGFIQDAGMFAESGAVLPRYVRTRTADDVAAAVVRAIERNLAEVDVAPLSLRLGAAFAGLAPGPAAAIQRRLGAEKVAEAIDEGHVRSGRR